MSKRETLILHVSELEAEIFVLMLILNPKPEYLPYFVPCNA
jgi:hypothetical protein